MRRRTIRPSSRHLLVFITMTIAFLVWVIWELGRMRVGRVLLTLASVAVFVFFAVGWAAR